MTQRDRNAGSQKSGRKKTGSEALESEVHADDLSTTTRPSHQMQQDDPDFKHGTQRPPSSQQRAGAASQQRGGQFGSYHAGRGEFAEARGEDHPGQLGYSQGGGAHDNWGAFEGSQQRQSPGYGQDEPWQHHHQDADYLRWREEHLRQLDEEYATWRRERYGKFSEEFLQWRTSQQSTARPDATSPQRTQETDIKVGSEEQRTPLPGKSK